MLWSELRFRIRALLRRSAVERELREELDHHAAVCGRFAERDAVAEDCREARGTAGLEALVREWRHAGRSLRRSPAFTAPVVLTLALGLGAAIAMYSVADAVLVQPLAYPDAASLVMVRERIRMLAASPIRVAASDIAYLRRGGEVFDQLGAYESQQYDLTGQGSPQRLMGARVGAAMFPLLRVNPELGRTFTPAEDQPGRHVVLLSDGLWRSHYGAGLNIVGRSVRLEGVPYTVVGVMPRAFEFPPRGLERGSDPAQLWVPLALTPAEVADVADNFDFGVIARMKPGVTLAAAQAQMTLTASRIQKIWESKTGPLPGLKLEVVVDPLRDLVVAKVRTLLELLMGAAGLLLLLSCANAANLFLVRAAARRREWALRAALGAGRARVAREALTESLLVSLGAAGVGLGLAWVFLRGLTAAAPASLPQVQGIGLHANVWLFACGLALLVGPLCGGLSARVAASGQLSQSLYEAAPTLAGSGREARWQRGLVVAQVSLAFVLACGAGLLLRSLQAAESGGAGVATDGRVTATATLPPASYAQASRVAAWYERVASDLERQPGIRAVAAGTDLPTASNWDHVFSVEGQRLPAGAKLPDAAHALVLGPYFRTMGIPLLAGRAFTPQEDAGKANVVIVSANLAARYWPGRQALGQRLKWGPDNSSDPWLTVVGVVSDVKDSALDTRAGFYTYSPYRQECTDLSPHDLCRTLHLVLASALPTPAAARQLRAAVAEADPEVPVTQSGALAAVLSASITPRRFNTLLMAFFGMAALLLCAIGLYGVLAFVVAGQRREIGVRMALGATPRRVLAATLRRGMGWTAVGLVVGIVSAWALAGTMAGLLYATPARDGLTWTAVAGLLLAVAAIACWLPALRASRTSPQVTLREG